MTFFWRLRWATVGCIQLACLGKWLDRRTGFWFDRWHKHVAKYMLQLHMTELWRRSMDNNQVDMETCQLPLFFAGLDGTLGDQKSHHSQGGPRSRRSVADGWVSDTQISKRWVPRKPWEKTYETSWKTLLAAASGQLLAGYLGEQIFRSGTPNSCWFVLDTDLVIMNHTISDTILLSKWSGEFLVWWFLLCTVTKVCGCSAGWLIISNAVWPLCS